MPRRTRTATTARPKRQFRFDESLAFFQYMLSLFGCSSLDALCEGMKDEAWEGWDEQNISRFYYFLTTRLFEYPGVTNEALLRYDQNITSHTLAITDRRGAFRWKYFQYMELLFTEIYLEKYFTDPKGLLDGLNEQVASLNSEREAADRLPPYVLDDLNKVAFWQATGSGKTLIMHVNILQYRHYLEKAGKHASLNRVILLTPNEGLSEQHLAEFKLSSMTAEIFTKAAGNLFSGQEIIIIDIHKLKEEGKEKTVSVDQFFSNNLVLVDEGHRGAGGEDWMDKRNRLCEEGFSFEYSATFGQAMKASGRRDMLHQYAKCILFDYSYKYFYGDGYGKEYSILNLAAEQHEEQRQLYLSACLLAFYQQLKVYDGRKRELALFHVEEPLWVFVGSKVNAVRTERGAKVSDVIDILLFLKRFLNNRTETIEFINRLLNGTSQLNDTCGHDLFAGRFDYLISSHISAADIYDDIIKRLFNCEVVGAEIHIDNLKGVQGEIGLRLGDGDYFGVINVGDDRELVKLCSDNGFVVSDRDFSDSLFRTLAKTDSSVKILIGSKKFTEGWNSWRVSTMGLMNVGRSEGSEIIQLFGRGVRLKGYNECLKRSRFAHAPYKPTSIEIVETLNVFGVRADYMRQFREYLEEEGVKGKDDYEEIKLPCLRNFGSIKLKYPRLKEGVNFKKHGPRPVLREPDDYLKKRRIMVNWYPKIEAMRSSGAGAQVAGTLQTAELGQAQCAFLDYDELYFELQKYKNERNYYNLNIGKDIIPVLMGRSDWYQLYIPLEELDFTSFEKTQMWQEIAATLLKKYCDSFYNARRMDYEKDKLEYRYLDEVEAELAANGKTGNLFDEYTFLVEKSRGDIIDKVKELAAQIESGNFADWAFRSIFSFNFDRHLYKPLIYIKDSELKVMPVALNDGEKQFVQDLKEYYETNKIDFEKTELYLLRNLGRGHGVGFFQAHNFYPDFIMWLVEGKKQQIVFIDPHGMRMAQGGFNDPKVQFHQEVKILEKQIGDEDVSLSSFIISVTPYEQIGLWDKTLTQKDFEDHHIVFQNDKCQYIQKILSSTLE
ncbi:MAG: Type III restriction enzyme, res subunit [Syntrophus sp. PtaB.Bin075]|nr:MAG: Type III restriction enzyme, res subunit [Syntrophus sp. PtaB.Bin075]